MRYELRRPGHPRFQPQQKVVAGRHDRIHTSAERIDGPDHARTETLHHRALAAEQANEPRRLLRHDERGRIRQLVEPVLAICRIYSREAHRAGGYLEDCLDGPVAFVVSEQGCREIFTGKSGDDLLNGDPLGDQEVSNCLDATSGQIEVVLPISFLAGDAAQEDALVRRFEAGDGMLLEPSLVFRFDRVVVKIKIEQ